MLTRGVSQSGQGHNRRGTHCLHLYTEYGQWGAKQTTLLSTSMDPGKVLQDMQHTL